MEARLFQCSSCGAKSSPVDYCFACGKARVFTVVFDGETHTGPVKVRTCISGKVTRYIVSADNREILVSHGGALRPTVQVYHNGLVRELYTDTNELVPRSGYEKPCYSPKTKRVGRHAEPRQKAVTQTPSLRTLVYRRDKGCVRCGSTSHQSVHHVVHRSCGGRNNLENLQALCRPCHDHVHEVLKLPSGTPVVPEVKLNENLVRVGTVKKKHAPVGAFHPLSDEGRLQRKRSKLNTNFGALEVQRLKFLATRKEVPLDQPLW